ncbi:toxin-antitoxin system YwqK family antitoxin [Maribacter hydrothermalis]|uniref:Uncharacterized protein n=1 Tax=Maribacter hydrothermalis TaxID=1836467 RepID=A0A1B7ZF05_9FLAO|nr:hypothetical protein [Maribacter hydrothermalis]APQ17646.1 hypothetical protein BTR34_10025 [Maribacter hydrothermalis]OBR42121.1 hypothetical protein A9200_01655 [Maribacter hydrothermalis]
MKVKVFTIFCALLLTMGCNKDDDTVEETQVEKPEEQELPNEPTSVTVLTGKFIDAAVQGLTFETATQEGLTNENGEFKYVEGEEITFKVGEVAIGSVIAKDKITPIDIALVADASASIESPITKNIAAFLQTLDDDQDHSNGINLTADVIAALGVQSVDFSSSITSTLADIIINISLQTGSYLEIVYPETAAVNMAAALELEYTPQENLALTHLLPLLESLYAADVPKSAVYKNSFNADGTLLSMAIILRYSGRVLHELTFSNYNEVGLPLKFTKSDLSPKLLAGIYSYPVNTYSNSFDIGYNSLNQIEQITFEPGSTNSQHIFQFTEWNEVNKGLIYIESITDEANIYSQEKTYTNTYEDDKLVTQNVHSISQTNDVAGQFFSNDDYNITSTFKYNEKNNFSEISNSSNREYSSQYLDDLPYESISSTTQVWKLNYTQTNKLAELNINSNTIGQNYTSSFDNNFMFDDYELVDANTFTSGDGFQQIKTLQGGYLLTSESFDNGLLSYSIIYETDGSHVEMINEYNDNSEIIFSYANHWVILSTGYYAIQKTEYFEADGTLTDYFSYDFHENGIIKETRSYNALDELNWIDYYDENGYWVKTEYFDLGSLYYTYLYENDANGIRISAEGYDVDGILDIAYYYNELGNIYYEEYYFEGVIEEYYNYNYVNGILTTVEGYLADGQLYLIEYYEDGLYVRSEFYDAEGNLTDTSTGKSFSVQANRRSVSLKLDAAKRLHDSYESKAVKRIVKSKYALRDKLMLEQN